MHRLLSNVSIKVNEKIYLKDPESSELGMRIISGSIKLIDSLGFKQFTFRKLAAEINSTEASVYRYFESKHKVLLYLFSWYWGWMEYRVVFSLANVESPVERLNRAIGILTEEVVEEGPIKHINLILLQKLIISNASKAYLTQEVDEANKDGVYLGYKQLVGRISDIILEINPHYKYPHMLISTMIEGACHQRFFAAHLPRLTDKVEGEDAITRFSKQMVLAAINEDNAFDEALTG